MRRPTRLLSTIDRYLAATYARAALATLFGVVAVVVVIDFADRAHSFEGPTWVIDALRLYANLSLDLAYQVAPSALLLAAGVAVSGLRRFGETTALFSLGVNPRRVMVTVAVTCGLACAAVTVVNEWVVVDAARRAEEIRERSFDQRGDLRSYLPEQRWFRGQGRIFNLRRSEGADFTDVSIYELGPGFRMVRRIDAGRMSPADRGWLLRGAEVSSFRNGQRSSTERLDELVLQIPETAEDFRLRVGRPKQFTVGQLIEQIEVRGRVGLETAPFQLELYGRLGYPFAAVPGAVLAMLVALRRDRKGHLTAALAEGIAISIAMWSMLIVCRAMGTSGNLRPAVAAFLPLVLLSAAAAAAMVAQRALARRPVPGAVPA